MNKYYLMKLIEASGDDGFRGRKRLQKVVFFLKFEGLGVNADYGLHRFGPYSHDLSQACSDLQSQNLLEEKTTQTSMGGIEYSYLLTEPGRAAIAHTESVSPKTKTAFSSAKETASTLIKSDLWDLELGSTILFYYQKNNNLDTAFKNACEFKGKQMEAQTSASAFAFAKSFIK